MFSYPNDKHSALPPHSSFSGLAKPPDTTSSPTAGVNIDRFLPDTEGATTFDSFVPLSEPRSAPSSAAPILIRQHEGNIYAPHYTGFRRDITPISFDAPTQPRRYLAPSLTSRRNISPVTASTSTGKRRLEDGDSPPRLSKSPRTSAGDSVSPKGPTRRSEMTPQASVEDADADLYEDAMAQARIEKRRRDNTVAARRCRVRKAEHVLALEEEVQTLRGQLEARDGELERALEELKTLRSALGTSPV